MQIENLIWDSSFFNLNIGKMVINKVSDFVTLYTLLQNNQEFDLIYIFSNFEIDRIKHLLVDKKARFVLVNKTLDNSKIGISVEEYKSQEVSNSLLNLTFQSGQHSRFLLDPKFGKDKFKQLYRIWIEKSVQKLIANNVYVTKQDDMLTGFITEGMKGNEMNIGLIATDENYRGLGLGKALVHQVIADFNASNQSLLSVYTQLDNKTACTFYEKCGFKLDNVEYIYHYWK